MATTSTSDPLASPEMAALDALQGKFPGTPPAWLNVGPIQFGSSNASRTTVYVAPGELEGALGGPLLQQFQAAIQELNGNPTAKGETYANDSLNGVELPAQPYPVPAIQ